MYAYIQLEITKNMGQNLSIIILRQNYLWDNLLFAIGRRKVVFRLEVDMIPYTVLTN